MGSQEPKFGDQLYNQTNLRHNLQAVSYVRTFASLLAGILIGIWGVTGWIGFLYYFAVHVLVSILLYQRTGWKVENYFPSRGTVLFGEVFGSTCVLTYILFWTLANNLVHLF